MKNNMDLTIIVPVYNTEAYIIDCLKTIDFKSKFKIEIIIINDGSTDKSGEIIKNYINESDNIEKFVYIEQENRGQAVARNRAIKLAKGKYLYFMDSDDLLDSEKFIHILEILMEKNLDGIFFDAEVFFESNVEVDDSTNFDYKREKSLGVFSSAKDMFIELVNQGKYFVSPCMYVIKKEKIVGNKELIFLENVIHEDDYFTTILPYFLGKVEHVNSPVFKRRVRANSTMTSQNKKKHINGYSRVFIELIRFYEKNNDNSVFFKRFLDTTISKYKTILKLKQGTDIPISDEVKDILRKYWYFNFKTFFATHFYFMYIFISKLKNAFK